MSKILEQYVDEPWVQWLLICLCRQEKRQEWHREIHLKIIEADGEDSGTVPDHPEWEYYYHGRGLCLSGPNEEELDVDFYDDESKTIDPYFFTSRIFGLKEVELPEARLRHWLPQSDLVVLTIKLLQGKVLEPRKSHVFRLDKKFQSDWDELKQLDFSRGYPEYLKSAFFEKPEDKTESQLLQEKYQKWLLQQLERKNLKTSEFESLILNLTGATQLKVCLKALRKVDHNMAAAVKVLSQIENAPVAPVAAVLKKLKPKKHHPHIAIPVCEFLLNRGEERARCFETLKAFSEIKEVKGYYGNPSIYDLALLLLIHHPEEGIFALRKSLRSGIPFCIKNAVALLALINEEWCYREFIQVLEDQYYAQELTNQRYIVVGLAHSNDPVHKEIAKAHLPKSRVRTPDTIGYTFDELVEENLESEFRYYLEEEKTNLALLDIERIRAIVQ